MREKGRTLLGAGAAGRSTLGDSGKIRVLMEFVTRVQIERLPEAVYLAASDDLPGLATQGATAVCGGVAPELGRSAGWSECAALGVEPKYLRPTFPRGAR